MYKEIYQTFIWSTVNRKKICCISPQPLLSLKLNWIWETCSRISRGSDWFYFIEASVFCIIKRFCKGNILNNLTIVGLIQLYSPGSVTTQYGPTSRIRRWWRASQSDISMVWPSFHRRMGVVSSQRQFVVSLSDVIDRTCILLSVFQWQLLDLQWMFPFAHSDISKDTHMVNPESFYIWITIRCKIYLKIGNNHDRSE